MLHYPSGYAFEESVRIDHLEHPFPILLPSALLAKPRAAVTAVRAFALLPLESGRLVQPA